MQLLLDAPIFNLQEKSALFTVCSFQKNINFYFQTSFNRKDFCQKEKKIE
jgi:hypothetical protein